MQSEEAESTSSLNGIKGLVLWLEEEFEFELNSAPTTLANKSTDSVVSRKSDKESDKCSSKSGEETSFYCSLGQEILNLMWKCPPM